MGEPLIQEGYIMIARKIRKSPTWQCLNIAHRIVMLELLLQAQHTPQFVSRNGEKIWLDRGQIATSYQQLANDVNSSDITPKVVRGAINKLEKLEFLAKDEAKARAKKGLLLTIVNWDLYQCPDNYKGKVEDKETGKARAKQGQSKGKARAINKNDNNEYNAEKDTIPYREIISALNEATGASYKSSTKKNQELIQARWNEGFRLPEFLTVIRKKVAQWKGTENEQYLRPITLFGTKFESYLNQPEPKKNGQAPGEEEKDFGFQYDKV